MNRILKNSLLGTAVLMLFFLTAVPTCMAEGEAVPLLPMTVEGVALIDGDPAPTGTVVAAYLDGELVKEAIINSSSGGFYLLIPGEAEDEGKPVTFKVDEEDSGASYDWESGKQFLSIELSVGEVADSGSSKKSSTSSSSSGSVETDDSADSGAEVIESSVTQPDVTVQEKTVPENTVADSGENAGAEQSTEPSEESTETSSTPGFQIIYAVAGLILLTFGSKLGGARRKP
ncbi:hypothetical protein ACSAZL_06305 [Methanosarcina sp. T3]|uniref:hypothetical protein n=1 Tax=Methanosarcina sp. T3 TaxID=3439062 RepID=UPI003F863961